MVSPSGRLIMRGLVAGLISITGAPGTTKCPVAPASAIALSTAILILDVLNIVSAYCELFRSKSVIVCFHAICRSGNVCPQ